MRYRQQNDHRPRGMEFNATPMVDVIFLLTIFFMLVTRFSSAEQVRMDLPKPHASQAKPAKTPERVIINCRIDDIAGETALYSVGPNRAEPLDVISRRLEAMHRDSPDTAVIIRADRRLPYGAVRPVMDMVARHGIKMLNVVAHVGDDE